jgi:hypothetical protein
MITTLPAHIKLALGTTYGSSLFNAGSYNGNVQIGPITLPVTGAGLSIILGALALAIAGGVFVWLRQNRNQAQ